MPRKRKAKSSPEDGNFRYVDHQKQLYWDGKWRDWFVGWNMRIMGDQIVSKGQGGLELHNTTFHHLEVGKDVEASWYQVAVDLKSKGLITERNTLILLIAKKVAASTSEEIIVEIMESHYATTGTFALFY